MAHGNAAIGHASVIVFAPSPTTNITDSFFANIIDFDWSGIARAAIDSTHMGTVGAKTFLSGGTYDPGGISVTLQFNTTATTAAHSVAAIMTATTAALTEENCTMQFGATAAYKAFAFATDMGVAAADEDVITQSVTLKFSGAVATAATVV